MGNFSDYMNQFARGGTGIAGAPNVVTGVGAGILASAPLTGPAAPFVALGGAIVTLLGKFGVGTGCGDPCVKAAQVEQVFEAAADNLLLDTQNEVISVAEAV